MLSGRMEISVFGFEGISALYSTVKEGIRLLFLLYKLLNKGSIFDKIIILCQNGEVRRPWRGTWKISKKVLRNPVL